MFTFTPQIWENAELGPVFSKLLYANDTVSKGLVRVLENIKYKQVVGEIGGTLVVQPYAVNPVSAGSMNVSESEIEPIKSHIYKTFTMDQLRSTRYGRDMKSGAAEITSNEFLQDVLNWIVPVAGNAIETDFYTKLVDKLVAATGEINIAGAVLTAANLADEIEKVYTAIPGAVLKSKEARIYAPQDLESLVRVVNLKKDFKDIFTIEGENISYLGVPMSFVPLADNTIVAGRSSDLILGTDLASDFGKFEVGKVNNAGDEMFIKATFSLDAAVVVPTQKVLYKAA